AANSETQNKPAQRQRGPVGLQPAFNIPLPVQLLDSLGDGGIRESHIVAEVFDGALINELINTARCVGANTIGLGSRRNFQGFRHTLRLYLSSRSTASRRKPLRSVEVRLLAIVAVDCR